MDSETRTFYYIVVVWVLLVLLGSLLQRCCAYREMERVYTNYVYGDTRSPNDTIFSQENESENASRNMASSEIMITSLQQGGHSGKTNEFDKPPSYNEDLPTYTEAIEMEKTKKKTDISK